ncbi:MAG: UDP-N-acetylmuramoyl-L-alanine--D-glutamate ligase [Clostridia bacterium]
MTKFENFLYDMKDKTVDIIGVGVSNRPLIKLLANNGSKVRAFDRNEKLDTSEFDGLDVEFILGDGYLEKLGSEIIFRTPGMHPENEFLVKARQKGCKITSEMEVFFEVCPCKIIAITGSDGKTTTTTLISKILENDGYTCHLGGNIGRPLLCDVPEMADTNVCVVELSSFQLQTMTKSADVSVITNITPNHLDMHKDMQEYIDAKKNVFANQTHDDMLVVNLDDDVSKDYKSDGTTVYFSQYKHSKQGVFIENDEIILNTGILRKTVMNINDIVLPGFHNVCNYMTAICATYKMVDTASIVEVAKTFRGVEHRIEFVRELDGVKYFNDSIATSPTRAIAGLNSFDQKVIQIAGGYDKKLDFAPLAPVISKSVKKLILVGATSEKIKTAVREVDQNIEILMCDDFTQGVEKSREIAEDGDVVILSPACASFDLFPNFAVRGNLFKKIVNDWR